MMEENKFEIKVVKMDERDRVKIQKLEGGGYQHIIPDTKYWRDKWEEIHQSYQREVALLNEEMLRQEISAWKKNKDFFICC